MQFINTTDIDVVTIRGVDFPKGEAVAVEDANLAAKLDAMPEFEKAKAKKAPKPAVTEEPEIVQDEE